ncbi:hypothetical protein E2320_013708 [Naja naja]|nr:hypothetical protein E2320_013708 [Naja naja]
MSPILEPFCPFSEKIFLESEGTSGAEELTGILGESVTFQVKISPPFEAIAWNKIVNANSRNIALVRFEPCSIVFFHPEFQRRVNISRDCRELHLSQLKKEDAGRYTAEIVLSASKLVRESFDLKVFRKAAKSSSGLPLWALLCLSKVGSLLLLGSSGLILRVKSRKAAGRGRLTDSQRSPPPSDPTDRGLR